MGSGAGGDAVPAGGHREDRRARYPHRGAPRPFGDAAARLDEIPGIGPKATAIILAEIGTDMTRFPTPGHLASWATFAPGIKPGAGKPKGTGSTGHGNRYLARILGEAAVAAGRTDPFLPRRRPLRPRSLNHPQEAQPRPRTRSPRLQRHPATRRLIPPQPIRLRCARPDAAACPVTSILGLGRSGRSAAGTPARCGGAAVLVRGRRRPSAPTAEFP